MKKTLIFLSFVFVSYFAQAQRYTNAIGLRGGYGSGITYKHNMGDFTVEAIGAFRSYYSYIGVLGELYSPLDVDLPGDFNLFYGGGAHLINSRYNVLGITGSNNYFGGAQDQSMDDKLKAIGGFKNKSNIDKKNIFRGYGTSTKDKGFGGGDYTF